MQRLIGTVLLATAIVATPVAGFVALAQTAPAETAPAQPQPSPSGAHGGGLPAPTASTPAPAAAVPVGQAAPTSPGTAAPAVPGGTQAAVPATAPSVSPAPISAQATLPHDLSPWGMFMAADIVVKAVMLGLAFASLVTWTIWLAKALELAAAKTRAQRAVRRLEEAISLDEAARAIAGRKGQARGTVADLVAAAQSERQRSDDLGEDGIKERAAIALSRIEARAGRNMARGTGLLATIGSTAPFVGLFGTVWGIMNSFIGISQSKTTNLAVVAPGIAEALLATAIGLVAAIPAVIIYNVFARAISGYRATLSDASGEVLRHLSRDLERSRRQAAQQVRANLHAVPAQPAAMPRVPAE
ncbi:MAG: tonB-system energizer ExbB [Bosea sp.]|uniref:tonB-system energizer ExbB n=1 Tax=Bosea sp. (in: a-proteobacteria) TaxID=1871050 RepID=UPI0023A7564D|nr:tonB-system energizer ExbB [Bosea sp. (in: a-proteobacteria)]MCP4732928.1 tonB-system energizer ExbB [Bosea sp. (in: a-proteobacteria)]